MSNSSGAGLFAPHPTIPYLYLGVTDNTSTAGTDPITFCLFRGNNGAAPSTDASTYHHGCLALVVDGTGSSVYINSGTYASPSWTEIGDLPPGDIALPAGQILVGNASNVGTAVNQYAVVAVQTNGTTPVPLFGTSNPYAGSLTSVQVISGSTTSVNVTLSNNGATYDVEATSTSKGVVTGSATFVPMSFTLGGSVNVVNSTAVASGQATFIATFITP